MNARVFLLLLFSLFFMFVWSADQKSAQLAVAKKSRQSQRLALVASGLHGYEKDVVARLIEPVLPPLTSAAVVPVVSEIAPSDKSVRDVAESTLETLPFEVRSTLLMVTSVPFLASVVEHDALSQEAVPGPVEVGQSTENADHTEPSVSQPSDVVAESDVPMTEPVVEAAEESAPVAEVPAAEPETVPVIEPQVTEPEVTEPQAAEPQAAELNGSSETAAVIAAETSDAQSTVVAASVEPVIVAAEKNDAEKSVTVSESPVLPVIDSASVIPLPKNLASGTWQVMTQSGEFFRITIERPVSKDRSNAKEEKLEDSFCIATTADGVRWCFVRSFGDAPVSTVRSTTQFFAPSSMP